MSRKQTLILLLVLAVLAPSSFAQTENSYQQTILVSDIPGTAAHTDPDLVNPWRISFFAGQPFWIADNGSGVSTIYDHTGTTQMQPVSVAAPAGNTTPTAVTRTVANATSDFAIHGVPSLFLFSSEDGTITGWGGSGSAAMAVDNSGAGAVYKGSASGSNSTGNFLFATNFRTAKVDVFDRNFNPATLAGDFTDTSLPAGYAPFNIQNIGNNQLVVTYALQDSAKHDDGAGTQPRLTFARANSGTLQLNIGGTNGFAGTVNLSCPSAPAMISCTFSPLSILAGSSTQNVRLTVAVASSYPVTNQYGANAVKHGWMLALPLFGGMVCVIQPQRKRRKDVLGGARFRAAGSPPVVERMRRWRSAWHEQTVPEGRIM